MKEDKQEEQRVLNEKIAEVERRIPLIRWRVGNMNDITLLDKLGDYNRIKNRKTKPSVKDYMRKVDSLLYFMKKHFDEQQTITGALPGNEPSREREEEQDSGDFGGAF